MGGNALKHLGVTRLNAHLFQLLTNDIRARCLRCLGRAPTLIRSFRKKESYGDADFLVQTDHLPPDWVSRLEEEFASRGSIANGGVVSMEISDFQVDFITVAPHEMEWADTYFAYNDLGNLMGRIAHKMGFKYGHNGLVKLIRDDNHVIGEINIPATPPEVFQFMDYDYRVWQNGFDTLEDIFEYTASSIYFSPEIYLLDNRNHAARRRDAKRPTYTAFLDWCETNKTTSTFDWTTNDRKEWHAYFLNRAFKRWPKIKQEYDSIMLNKATKDHESSLFNGNLVMEWTGATGKELGELIATVKESPTFRLCIGCENTEALKNLTLDTYQAMTGAL